MTKDTNKNRSDLIKWGVIALLSFFAAIIQSGFFVSFRPFGTAPDLCHALVLAIALKGDVKCGALAGLFSGFFLDCLSTEGISLLIPFYFLIGVSVGLISEGKNQKGIPTFLVAVLVGAIVRGVLVLLEMCLTLSSFNLWYAIKGAIAPYVVATLIFSLGGYLVGWVYERIFLNEGKTTKR